MEIWNAYLADGSLTDQSLYRDQPIPEGLYHLVVEAVIQHTDGSILFMKRDSSKTSYPHYYEASAGGSALYGEGPLEAILREIREETGLILTDQQLENHKQFVDHPDQCLFYCYWAHTDEDKSTIQVQQGETEDFVWVAPKDLATFLEQEKIIPRQKAYILAANLASK